MMKLERIIKRALLTATAAATVTLSATAQNPQETVPALPRRLAVNIHNCGEGCLQDERARLEELGSTLYGIRTGPTHLCDATSGAPLPDPYLAWLLEKYSPDRVIVTVSGSNNFGPTTPSFIIKRVRETLQEHPTVTILQLINEPLNFHGITPQEYVWKYAGPVREIINKEINTPARAAAGLNPVELWSAPWFGKDTGVTQTRAMYDEAQSWSRRKRQRLFDRYTIHNYPAQGTSLGRSRDEAIGRLKECLNIIRDASPVTITETGTNGYALHGGWFAVMGEMERLLDERMRDIKGPDYVEVHPSVVFYDFREELPEINGEYGLLQYDMGSRMLVPTSDAWDLLCNEQPAAREIRKVLRRAPR